MFLNKGCFNLKMEGGRVERCFVERDGLMMGFRERKRNGKKAVWSIFLGFYTVNKTGRLGLMDRSGSLGSACSLNG